MATWTVLYRTQRDDDGERGAVQICAPNMAEAVVAARASVKELRPGGAGIVVAVLGATNRKEQGDGED